MGVGSGEMPIRRRRRSGFVNHLMRRDPNNTTDTARVLRGVLVDRRLTHVYILYSYILVDGVRQ